MASRVCHHAVADGSEVVGSSTIALSILSMETSAQLSSTDNPLESRYLNEQFARRHPAARLAGPSSESSHCAAARDSGQPGTIACRMRMFNVFTDAQGNITFTISQIVKLAGPAARL